MKVPVGNKLYQTRADAKNPRLFVRKNGVTEYLELTPDKNLTTNGNKFYVMINNIRHYIKELFVIMGEYLVFINTYRGANGWSPWYGSKAPVKNFGFINGVSIKIASTFARIGLIYLKQEIKITNAKERSRTVVKLQEWGNYGSTIPAGTLSTTINLTQEELNKLGGSDTEILIDYRTFIRCFFNSGEVTTEIRVTTF